MAIKKKQVDQRTSITLSASTQDFSFTDGWPQGLVRQIMFRLFSTAFALGGGATVTDGEKVFLRAFTLETTLHGILYQNIDGLGWYRIMTMLMGVAADRALSSSAFTCAWRIPLGFLGTLRHPSKRLNDTALYTLASKPKLSYTVGVLTDLVTGGSPTGTATARLTAEFDDAVNPLPFDPVNQTDPSKSGDAPALQLEVVRTQFSSLSTTGVNEQRLPIGQNRNLMYIILAERSTAGAEVADIPTADTSVIELWHGPKKLLDRVRLSDLDKWMVEEMNIAIPAGYHLIPIVQDGKITDAEPLDPVTELNLTLDNVATSASRALFVYLIYGKPVKGGANVAEQRLTQ